MPRSALPKTAATFNTQIQELMFVIGHHIEKIARDHGQRMNAAWSAMQPLMSGFQQASSEGTLLDQAREYADDASQRLLLTLDILRERGNGDMAHEKAGTPPVLIYDYEVVLDGAHAAAPCNYMLLEDPAAGRRRNLRLEAALHDHRSARRPWRGYWRLQARQPGWRRSA